MTFQRLMNTVRRLPTMFPGHFQNAKHNHYRDFGWPETITFQMLLDMYRRNGLATAAVEKTVLRTWETLPTIWESEKAAESKLESDIRQRFADIRLWQGLIEADRRAYVGGYAGVILRFADSKMFNEPVDKRVPGGLLGLVEVVPAWAGQLSVAQWDNDERSPTYGQPKMYQFQESAVPNATSNSNVAQQFRQFELHPDRVVIWSKDGTVHSTSDLEPGYNDLIDLEKIKGAGGEGFWRNSKAQPVIEVSPDAKLEEMAQMMGVPVENVKDAIGDEVEDFQKGFDTMLMLAGMTAKPVSISLPIPEHFFGTSAQSFAASQLMPHRVLIGNQTGERASTEDQREFDKRCTARRVLQIAPTIQSMINRFETFGLIPEKDYTIGWESLLDASPDEKMNRAKSMAEINSKSGDPMTGGEAVFTVDEIRDSVGYKPLSEVETEGDDE